jgi:hypothetical protein
MQMNGEKRMTDEQLASLLAGQTAMVATICELLVERGLIDKTELCNRLYELLQKCTADPRSGAPIKHLLHILEA